MSDIVRMPTSHVGKPPVLKICVGEQQKLADEIAWICVRVGHGLLCDGIDTPEKIMKKINDVLEFGYEKIKLEAQDEKNKNNQAFKGLLNAVEVVENKINKRDRGEGKLSLERGGGAGVNYFQTLIIISLAFIFAYFMSATLNTASDTVVGEGLKIMGETTLALGEKFGDINNVDMETVKVVSATIGPKIVKFFQKPIVYEMSKTIVAWECPKYFDFSALDKDQDPVQYAMSIIDSWSGAVNMLNGGVDIEDLLNCVKISFGEILTKLMKRAKFEKEQAKKRFWFMVGLASTFLNIAAAAKSPEGLLNHIQENVPSHSVIAVLVAVAAAKGYYAISSGGSKNKTRKARKSKARKSKARKSKTHKAKTRKAKSRKAKSRKAKSRKSKARKMKSTRKRR